MAIPMRQSARIGWYLISKKIRRVEKFPLIVELFREKLTTEALEARVARMVADLEAAAQK